MKKAFVVLLIISLIILSIPSQAGLAAGEPLQNFTVFFADDQPYPVQWLSGKSVDVWNGHGTLKSASAPEDFVHTVNANLVWTQADLYFNQDTQMLSAVFSGQVICECSQCQKSKTPYKGKFYMSGGVTLSSYGLSNYITATGYVDHVIYVELEDKTVESPPADLAPIDVWFTIVPELKTEEPVVVSAVEDSRTRFSDLAGQVEVCFPKGLDKDGNEVYDDEDWHSAKFDMKLPFGTKIKTLEKSSSIISFPDMTTFELKPETYIILEKKPGPESSVQLLWGNLKANVKKMMKDGSLPVECSQAVAGIKGTIFVLEDDGKTSTLKVIEGDVQFASKATGDTQMVGTGEMISATEGGLGEKAVFDIGAENASWETIEAAADENEPVTSGSEAGSFPWIWVTAIGGVIFAVVIVVLFIIRRKKKNRATLITADSTQAIQQNAFCVYCGAHLGTSAVFCAKCGRKVG